MVWRGGGKAPASLVSEQKYGPENERLVGACESR